MADRYVTGRERGRACDVTESVQIPDQTVSQHGVELCVGEIS